MEIKSITPNLITDDMAATLAFYQGLLNFKLDMQVPETAPYNWCQISQGEVKLMWQTRASFAEDLGIPFDTPTGGTASFFTQVTDIEAWHSRLAHKVKMAFPMRTTFYGMKEFGFYDPSGYLIAFAERE